MSISKENEWVIEECGKVDIKNILKNIVKDNKERLSLFPIKDQESFNKYKVHMACFWVPEEGDLTEDKKDFETKLSEHQKRFVLKILAFFNGADIIVNANISANFLEDFKDDLEIQCFYGFQYMMENIHSESYSLMLDTLSRNEEEKHLLLNAIKNIPSVKLKAIWVNKYMNKDISLTRRLFGFTLVEGLQFSGSFCSIFYLKSKGLMPGLCHYNELISRDEGLHCKFSAIMFKRKNNKLPEDKKMTQAEAESIVDECVKIESIFVCDCLKIDLIGMNSRMMNQYIKFVGNVMLEMCGFEKYYREDNDCKNPNLKYYKGHQFKEDNDCKNLPYVKNPFTFMEMISLNGKTNFFEKRVSEYQKASVGSTQKERSFSISEDF